MREREREKYEELSLEDIVCERREEESV